MSKTTLRNLIVATLVLLIAIGGFVYMVVGVLHQREVLEEQITTVQTQRAQEDSYFRLQRIADESVSERETLSSYFLQRESDSIDFLNEVEALAPQAGVALQTDSLTQLAGKDTSSDWIQVVFTVSGSRANVQNFIKILETIPYLSQVTAIAINSQTSANWEATVTMKAYILAYDE